MARVVAFIPDLLFGSSVVSAMGASGHEPVLVSDADALRRELPAAQALIVDLTFEAPGRIDLVRDVLPAGVKTLAFYSHVEADVRDLGRDAGFDLVIPRSRMAREGPALIVLAVGLNPTDALVLSQVVLSFGIPFALVPLLILTSRRDVMRSQVNTRLTNVLAAAAVGVITLMNVVLLAQNVIG